jgi:uncharacterized membrane protein (UPF0127 family)
MFLLSFRRGFTAACYGGACMKTLRVEVAGADGARRPVARVRLAKSMWSRFLGLMGKRGLAEDGGLLIDPCTGVHTMFMRFALDVVFLDREGRITKIAADLRPYRMSMGKGGKLALELPAGAALRASLKAGDQLFFSDEA